MCSGQSVGEFLVVEVCRYDSFIYGSLLHNAGSSSLTIPANPSLQTFSTLEVNNTTHTSAQSPFLTQPASRRLVQTTVAAALCGEATWWSSMCPVFNQAKRARVTPLLILILLQYNGKIIDMVHEDAIAVRLISLVTSSASHCWKCCDHQSRNQTSF